MQEYVNGQLKSSFGDAFIRGNNGKTCLPCVTACTSSKVLILWCIEY